MIMTVISRGNSEDRIHLMPSFERTRLTVPLAADHPHRVHDHDVVLDDHLHAKAGALGGSLGRAATGRAPVALGQGRPRRSAGGLKACRV